MISPLYSAAIIFFYIKLKVEMTRVNTPGFRNGLLGFM